MRLPSRNVLPYLRSVFLVSIIVLTAPVVSGYFTAPATVTEGDLSEATPTTPPTSGPPTATETPLAAPQDGDTTDTPTVNSSGTPTADSTGKSSTGATESQPSSTARSSQTTDPTSATETPDRSGAERSIVRNVSNGVTVVTIDALGPSQIVAYGPNGSVIYQNRSYMVYHDVDPSPTGEMNVTYVASNGQLDASLCAGESECMLNVVEEVNLTTGNITRIHTRYSKNTGSTQLHDVDRINESVLLVGDIIFPDSVYMVNTTTGEYIWQWNVSEAYSKESGGRYPNDWTHLNDVELLDDGRVMANLRNQDQVIFLEPGEGLVENWTLGVDDDHDVLYEPHNPDYIPPEYGGPAVLIADSENNRVVEYQRVNGNWTLSWLWSDPKLEWPRDADRLPNGNTLIVDSHGQRIFEVNESGAIVTERSFPKGGYDAERLGTGDESTGGLSMFAIQHLFNETVPNGAETDSGSRPDNGSGPADDVPVRNGTLSRNGTLATNGTVPTEALRSSGGDQPTVEAVVHEQGCEGVLACTKATVTDLFPPLVFHGVLFVLPDWVTPFGGAAFIFQVLILLAWGTTEVAIRREKIAGFVRSRAP